MLARRPLRPLAAAALALAAAGEPMAQRHAFHPADAERGAAGERFASMDLGFRLAED